VVDLGNEKFLKPAKDIMGKLQQAGKTSPTPFDAPIKWTYFELWHHQGRRARLPLWTSAFSRRTFLANLG